MKQLPWQHPLDMAEKLSASSEEYMLLYSGVAKAGGNTYSYLALYPQHIMDKGGFSALSNQLGADKPTFENAWFGYLGYELLHELEIVPETRNHYIQLPDIWMAQFGLVLQFNHEKQELYQYGEGELQELSVPYPAPAVKVASLTSSMPYETYHQVIENTKEAIRNGDFYQANITHKFMGTFTAKPDAFAIFKKLCEASPSVYSSYLHTKDFTIISSSPERFLHIDAKGFMQSSPIKGTSARHKDALLDQASLDYLKTSEKERAENLMIVDLMRNDLAKTAITGTVAVNNLFEIAAYKTLYHLVSTITGIKRHDMTTLEAVKAAFPAGSMTGTPKLKAIKWCMEQENIKRGIYSGALGWFGGDGSCDLCVVIRTLVIAGNRFEFQVGGGITIDSDPETEWQETLTKAKGIMMAIGVK